MMMKDAGGLEALAAGSPAAVLLLFTSLPSLVCCFVNYLCTSPLFLLPRWTTLTSQWQARAELPYQHRCIIIPRGNSTRSIVIDADRQKDLFIKLKEGKKRTRVIYRWAAPLLCRFIRLLAVQRHITYLVIGNSILQILPLFHLAPSIPPPLLHFQSLYLLFLPPSSLP